MQTAAQHQGGAGLGGGERVGPREGFLPGMSPLLSHLPLSGELSTESALLLFQEIEGPTGASQTKRKERRERGQLVGLSS